MHLTIHHLFFKYSFFVFFFSFFISIKTFSQGQCLGGGCTGGYQYPSGTLSSNTNSWTTVSTNNWAGEFAVYNVTSGSQYEWSLLAADGGSVSYDAQLTLINNTSLAAICYSNDFSGNVPKIQWTATFTGTVRVLINQFNCTTNATSTTLVWRCSSCGSGSAPANDNCAGATNLTVYGSSCGGSTAGNVSGATQSIPSLLCSGFTGDANDDVWYKFTATGTAHTITVAGSASFDAVVDVRSGACNGSAYACADLTGSGGTEVINLTGLTVSAVYYVRVYDYASGTPLSTTFTICVTTPGACDPYYSTGPSLGDYIANVTLGTINNTTTGAGSYYKDYTAQSTSLQAGTSQSLSVTVGTYGGQTVAAWIDYNADGDFLDANEKLGESANLAASTSTAIAFTIPSGTAAGAKRMRVRTVWSNTTLDPCATYSYGEAEDYTVNITAACTTPGTPVSLSTTGITISQAQLNWAAGAPAGSATVTYYWAIGAASNVTYEANYLFRGTTTALNVIQASLSPGTTYYWTVRAETSCNSTTSAYPAAISFVTSCTTPGSPTALNTTNISTTSATLNWTAPASGSPTISYYWAVGAASNVTYEANYLQRGIASGTSVNVFGLNSNTTYYWTVKAYTSCNGTVSTYPVAISFVTTTVATPLVTWNGNTSTDWNTTTNWTPNQLPTVTDNVVIPAGRPNYPVITTEGLSVNNTTALKRCLSLHIDAGGTVTVNAALLGVYVSGTVNISGTFNHQAGSNSNLFIINSGGVVTVKNGGILNVGSSAISAGVPAGTVNEFNDLDLNGGTLKIDPGSKVFIMDCLRMAQAGAGGILNMTGGDLYIKYYGDGSTNSLAFDTYTTSTTNLSGGNIYICGQDNGVSAKMVDWSATATYNISGGTIHLLNEQSSGTLNYPGYCNFAGKALNHLTVNRSGATSYLLNNSLVVNGDITITAGTFDANALNITAAGNWTNNGTFTAGAGTVTFTGSGKTIGGSIGTTFNNLIFPSNSTYTINPSGVTYPNTAALVNGTFDSQAGSSLTIASAKLLDLYGATNTFNGSITAVSNYDGTRDIDLNNTCNFGGAGNVSADLRVYAGTSTLTSNFALNGDFIIRAGAGFAMTSHTFTANGNWTNDQSGGFTRGTSTVQFTGSGKSINGAANTDFNNLTFKSGCNYTLNPSGVTWPTNSALVYGTFNSEAGSTLTLASGKMLDLYGATILMDGTITAISLSDQNPDIDAGTDIYIENTATLSGAAGNISADINIWGGTTTLASNFTLNGDFKTQLGGGGAGTFVMSTHTFNLGGSWVNQNVFNAGTGTVKFTGSSSEVVRANGNYNGSAKATADFYNVVVDRTSDTLSMYSTPMRIANNFTILNGIYSTGWRTQSTGNGGHNRRLTVEKIATISSSGTFFVGYRKACLNGDEGLSSTPCGGCTPSCCCGPDSLNVPVFKGDLINYGVIKTNRPVVSAYQDIKLAGARITGTGTTNEFGVDFQVEDFMTATQVGHVDIQGDLIIQDNTSFVNTDPNNILTVRGNFYMYENLTHNGTVNVYRDFTSGSTTLHTPTTVSIASSTFNFYQSGGTSTLRHIFLKAPADPINFGNINIIAGVGNVRELRQNITVSGNLTIQSGTLDVNNSETTGSGGSISPGVPIGSGDNSSITLSGATSSWTNNATFNARAGTVLFTGSGTQSMGGSSATTFYNLTVNKGSSSELQFGNNGIVTGNLNLTAGYVLTTPSKLLTLNEGSTVTYPGSPASSFVRGPMKKIGTNGGTSEFVFPVGKVLRSARISFTPAAISATNEFTAEYFYNPYTSLTPVTAPLIDVSPQEYWQLDRGGASPVNAAVKLFWEDAASSGINSCAAGGDLVVARWTGAAWEDRTNVGGVTGTCSGASSGTVMSNTVTSFSPFTFGSKSGVLNPFPVELLAFDARLHGEYVDLFWTTASEINTDYFSIERSADMSSFASIGKVNAAGNSSAILHYTETDKEPLEGTSYYRLKTTDLNGEYSYSNIVPITIKKISVAGISNNVLIYPNPSTDGLFNLSFNSTAEQTIRINVFDLSGKPVHTSEYSADEGNLLMQLDLQQLSSGIYFLTLQTGSQQVSEKLIISR